MKTLVAAAILNALCLGANIACIDHWCVNVAGGLLAAVVTGLCVGILIGRSFLDAMRKP